MTLYIFWFVGILLLVWFALVKRIFHEYTNGQFLFFVFICAIPLFALVSFFVLVIVEYGHRDVGELFKSSVPRKLSEWLDKPFISKGEEV